jgi:hypothetical protein
MDYQQIVIQFLYRNTREITNEFTHKSSDMAEKLDSSTYFGRTHLVALAI